MVNKKYAIQFPDMQSVNKTTTDNIFSKNNIVNAMNLFSLSLDALGDLIELVAQKCRTNELGKQIQAQKAALDTEVEQYKVQQQIGFEEYTNRLKIQLQYEKEKLKLENERLELRFTEVAKNFSLSFEKQMQCDKIFHSVIRTIAKTFFDIKADIDQLADDYSQRREYVYYCELQRRSLELISQYMKKMI